MVNYPCLSGFNCIIYFFCQLVHSLVSRMITAHTDRHMGGQVPRGPHLTEGVGDEKGYLWIRCPPNFRSQ